MSAFLLSYDCLNGFVLKSFSTNAGQGSIPFAHSSDFKSGTEVASLSAG